MARVKTEAEITMAVCYSIMSAWQFNYTRRLEWEIWAAKYRPCPACPAGANEQCMNLSDVRRNVAERKKNKRPHDDRIDWQRLLSGLKQRGYYRDSIDRDVRNRLGG